MPSRRRCLRRALSSYPPSSPPSIASIARDDNDGGRACALSLLSRPEGEGGRGDGASREGKGRTSGIAAAAEFRPPDRRAAGRSIGGDGDGLADAGDRPVFSAGGEKGVCPGRLPTIEEDDDDCRRRLASSSSSIARPPSPPPTPPPAVVANDLPGRGGWTPPTPSSGRRRANVGGGGVVDDDGGDGGAGGRLRRRAAPAPRASARAADIIVVVILGRWWHTTATAFLQHGEHYATYGFLRPRTSITKTYPFGGKLFFVYNTYYYGTVSCCGKAQLLSVFLPACLPATRT